MSDQVSTRQLARAIQVSESSVKRWCDQGVIQSFRTAGGHRRIQLSDVICFLRENRYDLVRPEVLGLPATVGRSSRMRDRSTSQLRDALLAGDYEQARRIIVDLYLAKHALASILDDVIAPTFHEIGDLWTCGEAEIYQERRACEICHRILLELRGMLPTPPGDAALAMGGTPGGDGFQLANAMVDLVLYSAGWNTHNLGVGLPFETLAVAVCTHRPRLFWLSISEVEDEEAFASGFRQLTCDVPGSVHFVLGGRGLTESLRRRLPDVRCASTLGDLIAISDLLLGRSKPEGRMSVGTAPRRGLAAAPASDRPVTAPAITPPSRAYAS